MLGRRFTAGEVFTETWDAETRGCVAIRNYGRPHPPLGSAHAGRRFSPGKWQRDVLLVDTTHIKQALVRRNGLPESDQAALAEYFSRHGDRITHVSIERPRSFD